MQGLSSCGGSKIPSSISAVFIGALFVLGCSSKGPTRLVSSHEGYNDAVQLVTSREVLKNIVRMRYADPIQFLSVSTINASFSVTSGASIGASGGATNPGGAGAASTNVGGQTGASVGFSDSPTITFAPVHGAGAMKSLESPST